MGFIDYIDEQQIRLQRRLVCPFMSNIGLKLTGNKIYEVYKSPPKQLEVATAIEKEFGGDFIFSMSNCLMLPEALGLKISKYDYAFPTLVEHSIKNKDILATLKVPNPYTNKDISIHLESLKLLSQSFDKPLVEWIRGPFTLAVELADANNFLRDIIKNPDFIKELLEFTTEFVRQYVEAAVKAGIKVLCIGEPSAIMLSPKRFEKLVGSNLRKIFGAAGKEVWKVLHICGDSTHLLEQMLNCGAEGLSLDQLVNIHDISLKMPKDSVIFGNLDPIYVLKDGTPEKITEKTLDMLRVMKEHRNFIFSFGCDCLPDTPFENLKAAIKAGKTKLFDL